LGIGLFLADEQSNDSFSAFSKQLLGFPKPQTPIAITGEVGSGPLRIVSDLPINEDTSLNSHAVVKTAGASDGTSQVLTFKEIEL
jgi:hypothetical protein